MRFGYNNLKEYQSMFTIFTTKESGYIMKTLIKNGTIITNYNEYVADILIDGSTISKIGASLSEEADKIINAAGKYVFPGGIDQHVHYSFVYKGSAVRGFETTAAAALGGTTTVIEFVNQEQGKGLIQSVKDFETSSVQGISHVDWSFHVVITDPRPEIFEEIAALPEAGISTLKLFMAYKGMSFHADDETIIKALMAAKKVGVTVMVHAENGDIINYEIQRLISEGHTEPKYHAVSRPPICEGEATSRAIYLAEMAEAPIYIVHVTCKDALEPIKRAAFRGLPVYGETCASYLLFDESELARPGFEGAKFVFSPPLRPTEHQGALWQAVQNKWLNAVSTDHCGFDYEVQKHMGCGEGKSFADIPNGAPAVQNRINALWTYGVCTGKLSKQRFVDLIATSPARINGLTAKGRIEAGCDADIVIFDPDYRGVFSVKNSLEGVDYCTMEGMEQKGRPDTVLLRGNVVVENGQYVGKAGNGKFVPGAPYGSAYDNVAR